ncbi:4-hydroxy-tetrahydrodipicolinate synthase family protein [Catellatospora sichuanensis]|uniref:4-hydroxy-tetrahydrodipicolinate synthase family protein n=1 Tax=Catellatospora sichuanensis TaxID=1969805 RepID=UPI001183E012|nr:4-hydroxy-tetrahydrodipicolinate synthase [Catellatospora sichuanensis]
MTLHGLYIPLITPFGTDGAVALDALERLAHQMLDDGATGLVALGTTGEPGSLTEPEKQSVVQTVTRVCRERSAPLIVGAATPEALAGLAAFPEAVAALTVVPPFVRPGEAGVIAHFTRLAAASPVPLVVYDIPYRTGQYLTADALRRLAVIPNVAGVKYAGGGINEDTVALMADPPEGFAVLGGDDTFISPLLALGAHGGILSSAHLATAQFAELIRLWQSGDAIGARALGHRLAPLSKALFAEPNPTVVKAALHAQGRIPTRGVRLPLLDAHPDSTAAALKQLAEVGG